MDSTLAATMDALEATAMKVKAERDAYRNALVEIRSIAYDKSQDEITRINDMYDCATSALRSDR